MEPSGIVPTLCVHSIRLRIGMGRIGEDLPRAIDVITNRALNEPVGATMNDAGLMVVMPVAMRQQYDLLLAFFRVEIAHAYRTLAFR